MRIHSYHFHDLACQRNLLSMAKVVTTSLPKVSRISHHHHSCNLGLILREESKNKSRIKLNKLSRSARLPFDQVELVVVAGSSVVVGSVVVGASVVVGVGVVVGSAMVVGSTASIT